jgi:hypothetical protein
MNTLMALLRANLPALIGALIDWALSNRGAPENQQKAAKEAAEFWFGYASDFGKGFTQAQLVEHLKEYDEMVAAARAVIASTPTIPGGV